VRENAWALFNGQQAAMRRHPALRPCSEALAAGRRPFAGE